MDVISKIAESMVEFLNIFLQKSRFIRNVYKIVQRPLIEIFGFTCSDIFRCRMRFMYICTMSDKLRKLIWLYLYSRYVD